MLKILGVLFLLSVSQILTFAYGTSRLPKLSNCTLKEYTMKMRLCTTKFFVDMRSDPNGPCRPKFKALKNCAVKILKPCVPSLSAKEISISVERSFKEKTYCDNAGIEYTTLYPKVSPVPCAQTYYHQVPGCYNETLKLWQANKADQRLCRKYAKAKLCDKQLIEVHCIVLRVYREARELIELHYDNYNPFCMPLPIPPTNKTTLDSALNSTLKTTPKKTNAAWSSFHHDSFVNDLVLSWLMIIIFNHV